MITRRHLIHSMGALLAAPAIVRVGSLMPVRTVRVYSREEMMLALIELAEHPVSPYLINVQAWQMKCADAYGLWDSLVKTEFAQPIA